MSGGFLDTAANDPSSEIGTALPVGIAALGSAYRRGDVTLRQVVDEVARRIERRAGDHVWISRVPAENLTARIDELERRPPDRPGRPLWGVPFAVKDNIDVAGLVTTAACPAFAYTATRTAPAVQRLLDAGAVLIGKTNLDQFATGLSGTRSPYGACESVFGGGLISGGSSSGSAVAVAAGLVTFSLGTDTAGSGRVPAAMNGIVGLKPTRGLIPTTGVVPACRSLDCVSVFATTVADATIVRRATEGFDPSDPYSRPWSDPDPVGDGRLRIGIAEAGQLDFFGDAAMESAWDKALVGYTGASDQVVPVDITPLFEAGDLLYGPWLAERFAGLRSFVTAHPDDILPVTRQILEEGAQWSGADIFAATHELERLRRWAAELWGRIDVLVLPTVGTTFTIQELEARPVERNRMLGRYTQFANLLDTAALTLPGGLTADGRPASLTLVGPAHSDELLARVADRPVGSWPAPDSLRVTDSLQATPSLPATFTIAVIGRHLRGQARNHELLELGGTLGETTETAPLYRLYCIGEDEKAVPGLLRTTGADGASIEVELWQLPSATAEPFLRKISPPLGLGWVRLVDGRSVLGFLCEAYAIEEAADISSWGGWRAYQLTAASDRADIPEEP